MSISIETKNLVSVKQRRDTLEIHCDDVCMKLYHWHKVRELIFQMYKVHGEECDCDDTQPKCHIEIITTGHQSLVINYPYTLRNVALESYNLLFEKLKWHMDDRENIIQSGQ